MLKTTVAGLALLLFGPALLVLGMGVLMNPAVQASCLPSDSLVAAEAPTQLTATRSDGVDITLDQAQLTRAATIISVGGGTDGVGRDGVIVALMAALTESSLRMLSNTSAYPQSSNHPNDGDGGDHDSLGLFQMRHSTGWGSVEDLMDAEYQVRAFFGGPNGPNHGSPRGLLDISHWQELPKGVAAQAVEVSAYPDRYATYEPVAETLVTVIGSASTTGSCSDPDADPDSGGGPGLTLPAGSAGALIAAAKTQLGKPYVWGGGTYTGPSGVGSDGRGPGFDCSGLVLYAAYQATHGSLRLPHYSGAQITFGEHIAWADKQPGDLVFFTHPGSSAPHHVAVYTGGNQILQAPHTGDNVRFGTVSEFAGEVMTLRRLAG